MTLKDVPARTVEIRLTLATADQLERLANHYDVTIGHLIRLSIAEFLEQHPTEPLKDNSRLVGVGPLDGIRLAVAVALKTARSWDSLQRKLSESDLEYFAHGGGLALRRISSRQRLCKASEAGFGYSELIDIMQSPFPGHPHTWLARRVLGR